LTTFADDRADDLAEIFDTDTFAVTGTYQAPDGAVAAVSCVLLVQEQVQRQIGQDDALTAIRTAAIMVRISEIANPLRDGSFIIASGDHAGTWTIDHLIGRNSGIATCDCAFASVRGLAADGAHKVAR
jgi:hypothetical protein